MQHQPMLKTHRKPEGTTTVVEVAGVRFGDGSYPVIAGPAVVDTEADFRAAAEIARDGGAAILRGGAFTRADTAYSYQGRGEEALHLLARVGEDLELPVMTGVTEPGHVDLVAAHADVLLIDGDDMQNFALLTAVGGVGRPVIIKRGQSATIDEWLLAAEYVLDAGNPNAILCEPGIRTFEPRTTNTLDISAVPVVQRLSHLPVIIDPSHAAGQTELVIPLALAGRAVGADGLMVEVHPQPSASAVGPGRHLDEAGYLALMEALGVPRLRDEIDRIDREIVRLLSLRLDRSVEIGVIKDQKGMALHSPDRERELLEEVRAEAESHGLDPDHAQRVFQLVLEHSRLSQREALARLGELGTGSPVGA